MTDTPATHELQQILHALERTADDLEAQAKRLAKEGDYSAEMPYKDAKALRAAARLVAAQPPRQPKDGSPARCPFTGMTYWGSIEHPDLGLIATYGGPYDTYTIPQRDDNEPGYYCYHFDQDRGSWFEGVEDMGVRLVDDQQVVMDYDEAEQLRADSQALKDLRAGNGERSRFVGGRDIDVAETQRFGGRQTERQGDKG